MKTTSAWCFIAVFIPKDREIKSETLICVWFFFLKMISLSMETRIPKTKGYNQHLWMGKKAYNPQTTQSYKIFFESLNELEDNSVLKEVWTTFKSPLEYKYFGNIKKELLSLTQNNQLFLPIQSIFFAIAQKQRRANRASIIEKRLQKIHQNSKKHDFCPYIQLPLFSEKQFYLGPEHKTKRTKKSIPPMNPIEKKLCLVLSYILGKNQREQEVLYCSRGLIYLQNMFIKKYRYQVPDYTRKRIVRKRYTRKQYTLKYKHAA